MLYFFKNLIFFQVNLVKSLEKCKNIRIVDNLNKIVSINLYKFKSSLMKNKKLMIA